MKNRMARNFAKWDKGEFVYPEVAESLIKLDDGKKIGRRLSNCTICPVHNSSCTNMFVLAIAGICPGKAIDTRELMICSLGVQDDGNCPLNK